MIFYTVTTTGITLDIFISYFIYAIIMIAGFAVIGLILLFIDSRVKVLAVITPSANLISSFKVGDSWAEIREISFM